MQSLERSINYKKRIMMKSVLFAFGVFFLLCTKTLSAQHIDKKTFFEKKEINFLQEQDSVRFSPNPVTISVRIQAPRDKNIMQISFYSVLGNKVLEKDVFSKKEIELNLSKLKKGKYLMKVLLSDNTVQVKSLMKI